MGPLIPTLWPFAGLVFLTYVYSDFLFRRLSCLIPTRSRFPGIPGPRSHSWFMGNLGQLFNAKGLPFHKYLVDHFGGMVKVYGFFGDEQLYIADPRALHSILQKDQDNFEETRVFTDTNRVIFGPGLVSTVGEQHKRQRRVVQPVFSVVQLRQLTPVFYQVGNKLADIFSKEIRQQDQDSKAGVLDISEWMSRVALETVGQAVLGYSFDPLDSPHNNPYTSAVKELIPALFSLSLIRQFAPFLTRLGPPAFRRKLVEWTPHSLIQKVKNMTDVMDETAKHILQSKRKTLNDERDSAKPRPTKDIISILLRENDLAQREKLTDLELTGQMTVLIFGAQDTTSSALSSILYQLATHPEIQGRIHQEIDEALKLYAFEEDADNLLSYDIVSGLPWLDAVLKETLRLYPPVPFVRRTAVRESVIPYTPVSVGERGCTPTPKSTSAVNVPVGTTIFVSIAGSNRLESVWGPDAKQWKPERWLENGDGERRPHSNVRLPGIYSGMLSFLGGPRSCVGYKFAQIEMKILLVVLLSRFKFSPTSADIVWNLSQIISPSIRTKISIANEVKVEEKKGLPLIVQERGH